MIEFVTGFALGFAVGFAAGTVTYRFRQWWTTERQLDKRLRQVRRDRKSQSIARAIAAERARQDTHGFVADTCQRRWN